ncbi:UNVERIFIED_CONTAM: hypothetical protein RF653_02405 [Kocuria sp. CPCC 205316]|uniref:hypothetical protein n=1 Tax=Kocuria TaxID=57493 RepID=UPI0036DD07AE
MVSADQVSVPSALTPLTAFRWFVEFGGRSGTGWENRAVPTAPQDGSWQPVLWAEHVSAPAGENSEHVYSVRTRFLRRMLLVDRP